MSRYIPQIALFAAPCSYRFSAVTTRPTGWLQSFFQRNKSCALPEWGFVFSLLSLQLAVKMKIKVWRPAITPVEGQTIKLICNNRLAQTEL